MHCSIVVLILSLSINLNAQLIIDEPYYEIKSAHEYTKILSTAQEYTIQDFIGNKVQDTFLPLSEEYTNIEPNALNHWVTFDIKNNTNQKLSYFLQTAKPTTDRVTMYLIDSQGNLETQFNGHAIPFNKKDIDVEDVLFNLDLQPFEKYTVFIEIYTNGDGLSLPVLISPANALLENTSKTEVIYGLFYGIMLMAFTVYLFFYFALDNCVFLWYSLYILFIALTQFGLDGFFHQYVTYNGGWINDRAPMLFSLIVMVSFIRYLELFLDTKSLPKIVSLATRIYYVSVSTVFILVLCSKSFLHSSSIIVNLVGLVCLLAVILLVVISIAYKHQVDFYFITGIVFLIVGILIYILANLNVVPTTFLTLNITKIGASLEIIFLSIAMSNRIRLLRIENEKNYTKSLQQSKDINDLKNYFLSNLSHELRTPLNLIMAASSSIEKENSELTVIEQAQLIKAASKSLLASINGIVHFTEIEQGTFSVDYIPFSFHEVLENVKSTIEPRAKNKNLNFSFPDLSKLPIMVKGDPEKLYETLINLLDNAVKFTKTGGITFSIEETRSAPNKSQLTFYIKDTGIGIDDSKMSTIYESFSKHSSHDKRDFEGLGLGLFIVKSFVEMKKGSIDILQNTDGGTTCKLTIDIDLAEEKVIEELPQIENLKVLLVEDNKMNQVVIKMFAKKWNNSTLTIANNGQEGLDALEQSNFDVVLMDLQMPVMDGFEAISQIRSGTINNIDQHVPIIVITADSTKTTHVKAMNLGADDYVTKPVIQETLSLKIRQQLAQKITKEAS